MNSNIRKSALLRRYIIYNVGFVLIPVMILIIIYFRMALIQIIDEFEVSQEYSLTQAMRGVDDNMETFRLVSTQISNDAALTPYMLTQSGYDSVAALKTLKSYHSRASFLDDLYLYIYGGDEFYSGSGLMSVTTFANNVYQLMHGWQMEDFMDFLDKSIPYGISSFGGDGMIKDRIRENQYVVMTYPWSSATFSSFGTVMGILDVSYFNQILEGMESDIISCSYILDAEGRVLFESTEKLEFDEESLGRLLESYHSRTGEVPNQGFLAVDGYDVLVKHSEKNHWQYVSIFPTGQFAGRLFASQTPVVALVSILLIACIIFGFLMALRNYMPIHNLNQMMSRHIGNGGVEDRGKETRVREENAAVTAQLGEEIRGRRERRKESKKENRKDELREISLSLAKILQKNETMTRELDENRTLLAERVLNRILTKNGSLDDAETAKNLSAAGLEINNPGYQVLVLHCTRKPEPKLKEAVVCLLRECGETDLYCTEMDYQDYIAVLTEHVLITEEGMAAQEEKIGRIYRILVENTDEGWVLGAGAPYQDRERINRSYTEAVAACEAMAMKGDSGIGRFSDLKTYHTATPQFWYPTRAQIRLRQGINQANRGMVEESVRGIGEILKKRSMEMDTRSVRFMLNSIVQVVWPAADEMKLPDGDRKINELIHYRDVDDFTAKLETLCEALLSVGESRRDSLKNETYEKLIAYLDAHYCDQDISLKKLADMFDMTDSYLSRFFHDFTGKNFIDYLVEKRMKKACELLGGTAFRVRDVMEQVGYLDLASFTRKFTQVIGVSPGKYRDRKREAEPKE